MHLLPATERNGSSRIIFIFFCVTFLSATLPALALDVGKEMPIRGVVRAVNQATLATPISAPVVSIKFQEGEVFRKGDVLVEFDCELQKAQFRSAKAVRTEKAVNLKSASYLERLNAGSSQDVQVARAQLEKADAEISAISSKLEQCSLTAPFDGAVYEQHIRQYELPSEGDPILSIIDTNDPEIELIIPSNWLSDIEPGRRFSFRIDETGVIHTAIIRRLAPIVDPVSQTMKVYAGFAETEQAIQVLPGMSGDATFDLDWAIR